MSAARTLRALPTLLRVGVAETVAYRAEFLVWILTTTLPLVMLGLWTSVAAEAPFRGYSSSAFVAYYLSNLIVRNLTGSWVAWQLSEEIRLGQMSMRLLRPLHPYIAFAASHVAAIPFRTVVVLPIALLPHAIRWFGEWLPFRYMLSAPIELMTKSLDVDQVLAIIAGQAAWAFATLVLAFVVWNRGIKRFEAVGG